MERGEREFYISKATESETNLGEALVIGYHILKQYPHEMHKFLIHLTGSDPSGLYQTERTIGISPIDLITSAADGIFMCEINPYNRDDNRININEVTYSALLRGKVEENSVLRQKVNIVIHNASDIKSKAGDKLLETLKSWLG